MNALRNWYGGLTGRERVMVGVAGLLAGVVVLVYAIALPLSRAYDAAQAEHGEMIARTARLDAALGQIAAARAGRVPAGPVEQLVAARASAAGFTLQSSAARGDDAAVIAIPAARPGAILTWLDGLASDGLVVESLTMTPAADGSVALNATVRAIDARPAGPQQAGPQQAGAR